MNLKGFVRSLPIVGPLSYKIRPARTHTFHTAEPFDNSADYWDRRYAEGGDSGAGSYNRLAHFKAGVINSLVEDHHFETVIEFGCGDGAQLTLAKYPKYIGVDVSRTVLAAVKKKFAARPQYSFLHTSEVTSAHRSDMSLSLDVVYHLVEDDTFETYMRALFDATKKVAVIYASNKDEATNNPHVRHRKFTRWVKENRADFMLLNHISNRYPFDPSDPENTSFADFYIYRSRNW